MEALRPCYSYQQIDSDLQLVSGLTGTLEGLTDISLVNCTNIWATSALDVRTKCLSDLTTQPTYRESYVAAVNGLKSYRTLLQATFLCDTITNSSAALAATTSSLYFVSTNTLRAYLPELDMYGNFFTTANEAQWLRETIGVSELLKYHDFLDSNTRSFVATAVTRNIADGAHFYTLVVYEISLSTDGAIVVSHSIVFIPMVQYYYALDGHPWTDREVFVSECLLALVLIAIGIHSIRGLFHLARNACASNGASLGSVLSTMTERFPMPCRRARNSDGSSPPFLFRKAPSCDTVEEKGSLELSQYSSGWTDSSLSLSSPGVTIGDRVDHCDNASALSPLDARASLSRAPSGIDPEEGASPLDRKSVV